MVGVVGELGVVDCGALDAHWFESRTLAEVFRPGVGAAPGTSGSSCSKWAHLQAAARELLQRDAISEIQPPRCNLRDAISEMKSPRCNLPLQAAARELLYSGEWRPTANMPTPPARGELEKKTAPMLQLGGKLGEGSFGVVVEAEPGPTLQAAEGRGAGAAGTSRLAVKMCRGGGEDGGEEERGRQEAVLWEVLPRHFLGTS